MKRITLVLVILVAATHMAMAAPDQGPDNFPGSGHGPGFGHANPIIKMAEQLNLSAAQKHSVALVLLKNREEGKALRENMKKAHEALKVAMDKDPLDEAAIRDACKAMAVEGEKLALNRARVTAAIKAVLSPEQKAQMVSLQGESKSKMKERFEKGRAELDAWIDQHAK